MNFDAKGKPRKPFPEFVVAHLHTLFGLHAIVTAMAVSMKSTVAELAPSHPRIKLFGEMAGFLNRDTYVRRRRPTAACECASLTRTWGWSPGTRLASPTSC